MLRTDAILFQSRLFGDLELPAICMTARMMANGSAEGQENLLQETHDMLLARLETWQASLPRYRAFDNAVKQLVQATIDELEDYGFGGSAGVGACV